ncbi:transcriptional regulator, AraC family [Glycomyces sambucus]|uniref:Transcriptional regulator, AraC family n=1 Tax=Glycomyces sambucus TaxID=380244 RepID=A0A1G9K8C5_9ACTN|nr:transcriptional regulator, AraC family [Glycomyces sambucus]
MLSQFLDGPRARSAFVLKVVLDSPWSMRIEDDAPISIVAITHGRMWIVHNGSSVPVPLTAGDVVIARGTEHYVLTDDPAREPTVVIGRGGHCRTLDGTRIFESMSLGVRTWGTSAVRPDVMLVGSYQTDGEVSRWLLDALPPIVVLRSTDWESPLIALLADEAVRAEPGQQVVLDRLLDLLLVGALRAAFAGGAVTVPAWFTAESDEVVGPVIRRMQDDPGHPWTVAELAAAARVSRAQLARRFQELVGEPPMTFLTRWRMSLAADLMVEPDATVTAVAKTVGYGSPFTFSTAFKRAHGRSPRTYRDEQRAEASDRRSSLTAPHGA